MKERKRASVPGLLLLGVALALSFSACEVDERDLPAVEEVRERLGDVPEVGDTSAAAALSGAFRSAADRALAAVVYVQVEQAAGARQTALQLPAPFRRFFEAPEQPEVLEGAGTGFIFDQNGYILTNNHVVAGATDITVRLVDGREYTGAQVVGADPTTDIAVIRIDAEEGADLPVVELGNSDAVRVGDWVLALGNPLGLEFTVTAGIVSAKGRSLPGSPTELEAYIQTDAAINRGNSGGPLINLSGQAVGMNTAIFGGSGFVGYGFAIPVNLVRRVVEDLLEVGYVRRPRLGVYVKPVTAVDAIAAGTEEVRGAYVTAVEEDSPAGQAGIAAGEIILALDGEPLSGASALTTRLAQQQPGDRVTLTVFGEGETREVAVQLGSFPRVQQAAPRQPAREQPAEARLGLSLVPLESDLARRFGYEGRSGLVVADVSPTSPAARVGVRQGQLLVAINGQPVTSGADVRSILQGIRPRDVISLRLVDPELGDMVLNFRARG